MDCRNNSGSALLMALIFLSLLLLIAGHVWNKIALLVDLTSCVYRREQQEQANAGALYWAIALYKEYQETIDSYLVLHPELSCTIEQWPPKDGSYQAHLTFKKSVDDSILCRCSLLENNNIIITTQCFVRTIVRSPTDKKLLSLYNWSQPVIPRS